MSQLMRGPRATVASITSTGNWLDTGTTQTLTVPSGNPGTIKFTSVVTSSTAQYNKNGAGYVSFVNNDTLAVANGNTLKFTASGGVGQTLTCTVIDNTTGATIGTVDITVGG